MCFTLICYEEVGGILEDVSLFCPAIACWPHLMQNECLQARRDCYGRERRQALLSLPRFGSHLNLKECLHPGGIQKTRCPFQGVPLCTQSSLSGVGPPKFLLCSSGQGTRLSCQYLSYAVLHGYLLMSSSISLAVPSNVLP